MMMQLNPLVGDIPGNTRLLIEKTRQALETEQPDIVVFSELFLTAYPPEDLLLRPGLDPRIAQALSDICQAAFPAFLVVGYPGRENGELFNMLAVIHEGEVIARYKKQCLPNYQVFDEKRYFNAGSDSCLLNIKGTSIAFTICEDLWQNGPMQQAASDGARLMININGSPFHKNKHDDRFQVMSSRAQQGQMPVVYVNQVGGQDELVFDGGSMLVDEHGQLQALLPFFQEAMQVVEFRPDQEGKLQTMAAQVAEVPDLEASIYQALVLGVRDYVRKNGFQGVVLGLSGGIDSALSLAVAVDALGPENVHAVMMPYKYTAKISLEDSEQEARTLGVNYKVIPIGDIYETFMQGLAPEFEGTVMDLTEQNLQSRCRGVILMAISNKKGLLVLTTGNKSEMAVGYSTLYGDMAGGFDVLKDVPKTMVYRLATYRNEKFEDSFREVIPQRVIDRPPSAELAPGQVDEDNLPPYDTLDAILELYVDQDMGAHAIVEQGFDEETVGRVLRLVDINEHKRRQAPIGVRISKKGFGRDRRLPVTSGWKQGH